MDFQIPIISVGNLTIGGSGKTPLTIALAKDYENVAVVLRGYKRESKGVVLVSQNGDIKCDVKQVAMKLWSMQRVYQMPL